VILSSRSRVQLFIVFFCRFWRSPLLFFGFDAHSPFLRKPRIFFNSATVFSFSLSPSFCWEFVHRPFPSWFLALQGLFVFCPFLRTFSNVFPTKNPYILVNLQFLVFSSRFVFLVWLGGTSLLFHAFFFPPFFGRLHLFCFPYCISLTVFPLGTLIRSARLLFG